MASDNEMVSNLATSFMSLEQAMQKAIARMEAATAKMDKASTASRKLAQANRSVTDTTKAATNAAQGLSFQLNDIAVSLSGGASPFAVMMQQGSQVSQVFQQLKAQGGSLGTALTGALGSMLNPISLATFAVIGLGGAFATWAASAVSGTKEVDSETLKLLATVDKLGETYASDLGPQATKALSDISLAAQRALDAAEMAKVAATLKSEVGGAFDEVRLAYADMAGRMQDQGLPVDRLNDLRKAFNAIADAIDNGGDSFAAEQAYLEKLNALMKEFDGDPLAEAIAEQIKLLTALEPKLRQTTDAVVGLDTAQKNLNGTLSPLIAAQKEIGAVFDALSKKIQDNRSEYQKLMDTYGQMAVATRNLEDRQQSVFDRRAQERLDQAIGSDQTLFLQSRAVNEKIRLAVTKLDAQFADALAQFLRDNPGVRLESAFRTFQEQAHLYATVKGPVAKPGTSRHEVGEAADLSFGGMSAAEIKALQASAGKYGLQFPLPGSDAGHIQLIRDSTKELDKQAKAAQNLEEQYQSLADRTREKTSLQEYENQINADATLSQAQKIYLIEREKTLRDLNASAQATGNQLTQEEIAKNTALADTAGRAAQKQYELAEAQRASAQSAKQLSADQQQLAQQYNDMASSALSGFINDLRHGVSAGEAFSKMLDQIIGQLIEMAIRSMIIKSGFGTMLAGFGGFKSGGTVGFTGGAGGKASPLAFAGAKRYAAGGIVGADPGAMPIIAHRGEVIIPTSVLRKVAGQTRNPGGDRISIGPTTVNMSIANGTGTTRTDSAAGQQFASLVDKAVQQVIVRESRPGGLLRRPQGAH